MKGIEFQIQFNREINQIENVPEFNTADVYYWLNQAIRKFIKTRYSGLNIKQESFEQTQKRIEDLRSLLDTANLTSVTAGSRPNSILFDYSDNALVDYWLTVSEEATITFTDLCSTDHTKRVGITPCTHDQYVFKVDDPYSPHILHYDSAEPLRLFVGHDSVELIGDGNYTITTYHLTYIKEPSILSYDDSSGYTDVPEHAHDEIVKLAVSMALENLQNPRYQSQMNEVNTME